MRKTQFPANHLKKIKRLLCFVLTLVILLTSVSGVVLAAEDTDGTAEITSAAEEKSISEQEMSVGTVTDIGSVTEETDGGQGNIVETDVGEEKETASETEEETTSESEDEAERITYDQQPTTMEEVQAWIDTFEVAYQDTLGTSGFAAALAAMEAAKPHWEFEVAAKLIPSSYHCELVTDEQASAFGADYYTVFKGAVTTAADTWDGTVASGFNGGDGSVGNPYQIHTGAQLAFLANRVNAGDATYIDMYYVLTNDIDLSQHNWTPIGTATQDLKTNTKTSAALTNFRNGLKAFKGTFEGNAHEISGIKIDTTYAYQGLFGCVEAATIKNLAIAGGSVKGSGYVGMLAGLVLDGTEISDCITSEGMVTGATGTSGGSVGYGYCTGGLIGSVSVITAEGAITIADCTATASVQTTSTNGRYAGGFIGDVYFLYGSSTSGINVSNCTIQIKDCKASGSVKTSSSSAHSVGGFAGHVEIGRGSDNAIKISDCSASGDVESSAVNSVGGFIGRNYVSYSTDATINFSGCSASGNISTPNNTIYVGGLIGYSWFELGERTKMTVSGCSYETGTITATGTAGAYAVGGLIGWTHILGSTHTLDILKCHTTGDISVTANGTGGNYIGGLTGHITIGNDSGPANADYNQVTVSECSASGTVTVTARYGGACSVGGIMGRTEVYGTTNALTMSKSHATGNVSAQDGITGALHVGGFIGSLYFVCNNVTLQAIIDISDCSAAGIVTAQAGTTGAQNVGGFLGYIHFSGSYGTVNMSQVYADGDVSASAAGDGGSSAGGLTGYSHLGGNNNTFTVTDCHAKGDVVSNSGGTAGNHTGGLIGFCHTENIGNTFNMSKCDAVGNVTANGSAGYGTGGLVGWWYAGSSGTTAACTSKVSECYATGNVTTSGSQAYHVGGLIGYYTVVGRTYATLSNSYATGEVVSGSYYGTGGLIGWVYTPTTFHENTIKNCYATGNVKSTYPSYFSILDGVGGLIGVVDGIDIIDSYAIGSVTANAGAVGSMAGVVQSNTIDARNITNCYATGTAVVYNSSGTNNVVGGYVGRIYSNATNYSFSNCYFDTTMTGKADAIGHTHITNSTINSNTLGNISGKLTEKMINIDTFDSSWGVKSNFGGRNAGVATYDSPWYIDNDVTYPYLYYQYDGHSSADTNYNLKSVTYTNTSNATVTVGDRTDFYHTDIGTFGYNVISAGAVEAYFPYNQHKDPINQTTATFVTSDNNWSLYSLGSISASDIVAFTNGPTATKESDREDLDGDGVTDTYVGDTVKYTITLQNAKDPDLNDDDDYTWKDVVVTDPLPAGVKLNDNTVKITDSDGTTTTASVGTGMGQYEYDESTNTLTVYIGNIPESEKVIITFETTVLEAAVGESIRNAGTATGEFRDNPSYTANYDDNNDDPVKAAYKVTYDGNEGATSGGGTTYSGGYYHTPDLDHAVLGNDTTAFIRSDYHFLNWNTKADGTGVTYEKDDVITLTGNITLYAQWEEDPTMDFSFLKVDAQGYSEALSGAEFKLYICTDSSTSGHTHTALGDAAPCWVLKDTQSSADGSGDTSKGLVKFTGLSKGTYLLAETIAPRGYELPKGQWLIKIDPDSGSIEPEMFGSTDIPAFKDASSIEDAGELDLEGIDFLVGNREKYALPMAGSGGIFWLMVMGALLAAAGTAGLIRLKRREKKAALISKSIRVQ